MCGFVAFVFVSMRSIDLLVGSLDFGCLNREGVRRCAVVEGVCGYPGKSGVVQDV